MSSAEGMDIRAPIGGLFTLLFIVERFWLGMPPPGSVMYRDQPLAE